MSAAHWVAGEQLPPTFIFEIGWPLLPTLAFPTRVRLPFTSRSDPVNAPLPLMHMSPCVYIGMFVDPLPARVRHVGPPLT